tara:strand:+ start:211 stop:708 length:498 start_codon:yes stop_codon:yes gene_type:complete
MTGKEWQQTVRVMKLKWPNFHWSDDQVKSAYDSLKEIPVQFVEKAIEQSFKSGEDFAPNASNIYATAMEIQRYEWNDPSVKQIEAPKGGLKDYLLSNNYESFAHAMFESAKKRFDTGTQEIYEVDTFDYDRTWEEAKNDYLQMFNSGLMTKVFTEEEEEEANGIS